jgi:hypothetical protein
METAQVKENLNPGEVFHQNEFVAQHIVIPEDIEAGTEWNLEKTVKSADDEYIELSLQGERFKIPFLDIPNPLIGSGLVTIANHPNFIAQKLQFSGHVIDRRFTSPQGSVVDGIAIERKPISKKSDHLT